MNFLVIARDHKDSEAINRRLEQREAHLKGVKALKAQGKVCYAVALIEEEKMVGSVMVFSFDTREEFENWKRNEPYITGNVWNDIEVSECAIPPLFQSS